MLHHGTLCRVDSLTPMTSGVEGGNSTVMFLEILAAVQLVLSSHWLPFKNLVYLAGISGFILIGAFNAECSRLGSAFYSESYNPIDLGRRLKGD